MLSHLLHNEVLAWRLVGAAIWTVIGIAAAGWVWGITASPAVLLSPWSAVLGALSFSGCWRVIKLALAQSVAFLAHSAVISTVEAQPVYGSRLLGGSATPAASLLVSKVLGRVRTAAGLLGCCAYLAAHTASALLFLVFDPRTRASLPGAARWELVLSACLALVHSAYVVYWSQDVVVFPAIQRHRYFRLKRRLPSLAAHAAYNSAAALGLALLAEFALGSGTLGVTLRAGLGAWLAASLCCFCWLLGVAVLDVVMSERLRPDDYSSKDVLGAMLACLDNKQDELMRDLALHDLSCLALERGRGAAWRRQGVFADDAGERWRPIGQLCIAEVDGLTAVLAAALPQHQPKGEAAGLAGSGSVGAGGGAAAGAGAAPRAGKKWNALPLAAKGALSVSAAQLRALAAVRCRYQRAALCVRTLAGFATASLEEDKYGVLQLTQPGLGELLLCLLSALHAAQHFAKLLTTLAPRSISLGPWRGQADMMAGAFGSQSVDAAVLALLDTLSTSLYSLAATFGGELPKVLRDCKAQQAFGTPADAAALLQGILAGQE